MSNHLAIAAVTATLHARLRSALGVTGLGIDVSHTRPGTPNVFPNNVGVYAFLYMITPSAALRGIDLPTRDPQGNVVNRPTSALELHYLLSFQGDDAQHQPQRMLGAVVSELHANPVLTPLEIQRAVAGGPLEDSRLEEQVDRVRFTPEAINFEEFSKLWSVFLQTQYILSVAYKASVVLVEAELPVRVAARVRDRGLYSTPMPPSITSLDPQIVQTGARVVIKGSSFTSDATQVRILLGEATPVMVTPALVLDDRVEIIMPPEARAGIRAAQVVTTHSGTSNTLPPRPFLLDSGVVPFLLAPRILRPQGAGPVAEETLGEVAAAPGTDLTIDVVPPLANDQGVSVLIGPVRVPVPFASRVNAAGRPTKVTFTVPGDPSLERNAPQPLRIEVDRAVSVVEEDKQAPAGFRPRLLIQGGP